jgi:hypothetical protein
MPFDCLVGNLGQNPLQLVRYGFPAGAKCEVFERGAKLLIGEAEQVEQGESRLLLADRDVPDYRVTHPVLMLQLHPKVFAPLIWMFDRDSGTAEMASASSEKPVRYQAIAGILQHILRDPALPAEASLQTLSKLFRHDLHFVRWSALQSMCAIDFEFAKAYLLEACRDPHPAVVEAANRAASRFLTHQA